MCGILGSVSNKKLNLKSGLIEMNYRGPDYSSIVEYENLSLGHNRLAIIDLDSDSNQPFVIGDNTIIFNGEIYNYLELRNVLLSEGHKFKTKGDTEVLLLWLITRGIEAITDVEGMFAFAWFNQNTKTLTLCRDSIGIKPLYIYHKNENLIFSSEIKPIFKVLPESKRIDKDLLAEYLLNGFIYEPDTGFKNIRKLEPGSYEVYDLNSKLIEKRTYWNLSSIKKQKISFNDVSTEIKNSIDKHLVADVPVGLFFSGGIDSSILLSQTKSNILPVTVKSSEIEYKEAGMSSDYDYALRVGELFDVDVLSIDLLKKDATNLDFLNLVKQVALGNEELIADFTFQSSKILSEKVRDKGFVVMLSGMGADEIFAGYPRYRMVKYEHLFGFVIPLLTVFKRFTSLSKKIDRFKNYYSEKNFGMKYSSLLGYYSRAEVNSLLKNEIGTNKFEEKINKILEPAKNYSKLRKAMFLDFYGFLSHNFLVSDKSSMKASIELRVPLATKKLYELSWNLSDDSLVSFLRLKKPLRRFLLKYLPQEIVNRKKAGFNPPLDNYIKNLGSKLIVQVFEENNLYATINEVSVLEIVNDHFEQRKNNTFKIYQLLHLSYWLNENSKL